MATSRNGSQKWHFVRVPACAHSLVMSLNNRPTPSATIRLTTTIVATKSAATAEMTSAILTHVRQRLATTYSTRLARANSTNHRRSILKFLRWGRPLTRAPNKLPAGLVIAADQWLKTVFPVPTCSLHPLTKKWLEWKLLHPNHHAVTRYSASNETNAKLISDCRLNSSNPNWINLSINSV